MTESIHAHSRRLTVGVVSHRSNLSLTSIQQIETLPVEEAVSCEFSFLVGIVDGAVKVAVP